MTVVGRTYLKSQHSLVLQCGTVEGRSLDEKKKLFVVSYQKDSVQKFIDFEVNN